MFFGEISTNAYVDINRVVRDTIAEIGYTNTEYGFSAETVGVHPSLVEQSPDIAQGVNEALEVRGNADQDPLDLIGAGDQGLMFGFAVDETEELHAIANFTPAISWFVVWQIFVSLVKSAIFVQMLNHKLQLSMMKMIVQYVWIQLLFQLSTIQKSAMNKFHNDVINKVIKEVIPASYLDEQTKFFINPTGRFVIGGPQGTQV